MNPSNDPDFWLRVARAIGLEAELLNGSATTDEPWVLVDKLRDDTYVDWHPPTNPAQAWEMHSWVRGQGYRVAYRDNQDKCEVFIYPREYNQPFLASAEGHDDTHALGAAILEMVGVNASPF